jgi:hypothetical protein
MAVLEWPYSTGGNRVASIHDRPALNEEDRKKVIEELSKSKEEGDR